MFEKTSSYLSYLTTKHVVYSIPLITLHRKAASNGNDEQTTAIYMIYSSDGAWGIVRSSIFTPSYHHPPYPFFTHHFSPSISPRKITSINPFHVFISRIILQLHFFTHSSYHSSTPFFFTSFFPSKKFLIIHFSPSSHHHLNYAPRSLIEFRLVNNIDTLIRKMYQGI